MPKILSFSEDPTCDIIGKSNSLPKDNNRILWEVNINMAFYVQEIYWKKHM